MMKKKPKPRLAGKIKRWTEQQTGAAGALEGVRLSKSVEAVLHKAFREGTGADEVISFLRQHFKTQKT